MKKYIKVLLKIALLLFAINVFMNSKVNAETESVNGFEWTYTVEDGKAVDVYISSGIISNSITVPGELGGYPVARIGNPTANYNIANNVSTTSLTTIYLPSCLEEIGDYAFRNMQYLRTVGLEENNTTLPDISKIGNYAFNSCTALTEINIPNSVTSIGNYSFYYCTALTEINIPNSVTTIGNNTFNYCISLTEINIPDSVIDIGLGAFSSCNKITSITLPNSITNIKASTFSSCSSLTTINLPETLTEIGNSVFSYCTSLTEINIPNSVTTIGNSAFQNCTNLVNVTIGSGIENIGNYALYNIKDTYISREEGTVNIGSNNNGTIHYLNCKHKMNISVPEGIKVINTDTNEEITTGEIECGESLNYKFIIEEGYEYGNLTYTFATKPVYSYNYYPTQPNADVETIQTLNLDNIYSNTNILRDFKISIQEINSGVDFVLRKYITKVNGLSINEDRAPTFDLQDGKTAYLHSKTPVVVNSGDIVRYKIRIYNEGKTNGYATEIKEYLPESLQFVESSGINKKYNWVVSEDGRTVTTDYLSSNNWNAQINRYTGSFSTIQYKEVEIECKVLANRDEENKYIASITEITASSSQDADSTPGDITLDMLDGYKKEESLESNSSSYIHGEDDDFDYECILVPTMNDISTDYRIRVEKIDSLTGEMLNGAKFNLLNENGEILQEGVTEVDGVLDFGMMNSVGEGTDIYYIEEVERPEGYNNPLTYKVKLTVTKEIYDYIEEKYTLDVKCDIADINVEVTRFEEIPIYTKEQLEKIGSNEEIYIEEADETFKFDNLSVYKLMQDIDLQDKEWTPLNAENCMLDGNGLAIKNLKIETDLQDIEKVGLFSTYSGYIANLTLENVNIIEQKTSGVTYPTDKLYTIGGLVGYMSEGIIKNCNVTGTITADIDNVGGFVGHSEKEKIIIFKNCTNSINITATKYNIGGLIGCAKGAININECTNKGSIIANGSYSTGNVGGLIGCADPEGYEMSAIKASYDKKDNIITLVVKNDSIIGKYKLKLENIDIETLKLIEGSTFDILDENKQVVNGYSGVELENGQLEIATIDITTIGTDVYYLKQVTTPEGYEILVNNEYIKVIVNKKWDKENDKYVVEVNTEIINKEDYEQDEVPEDVSTSKTGIIHKIMEYTNVTWTTNKVAIQNSKNEGNISSSYYNAAGLVGRGKTSIEIDNCENIGNIEVAQGHAGGLLGEITKLNELSVVEIYNSINKGIIIGHGGHPNSIAGLASFVEQDIIVDNCINEGKLNSTSTNALTVGGIVGTNVGNVKITNSSNSGNIIVNRGSHSGGSTGGILGKRFVTSYGGSNIGKKTIIKNCNNTGNIIGGGHTGGIVGMVVGDILNITDCTNIGCDVINGNNTSSGDLGGIAGSIWCTKINIENCDVSDGNIHQNTQNSSDSSAATGGIVGNSADSGVFSETGIILEELIIRNCNSRNLDIYSVKEPGGIVGHVNNGGQGVAKVIIVDCTSENNIITNLASSGSYCSAGGIISCVYGLGSLEVHNCKLIESSVKVDPIYGTSEGDVNVGGIIGQCKSSNVIINDFILYNSEIKSLAPDNGRSYSTNNVGGVLAGYNNVNNLEIRNCYLDKLNIQTLTGNLGGIVGSGYDLKNAAIEKCNIENSEFTSSANKGTDTAGGIIGYMNYSEKLNIKDCNFVNSNVTGAGANTSGIVAYSYAKENNIENCSVKDSQIISSTECISNNYNLACRSCSTTGGIIAGMEGGKITNCDITNSRIEGRGTNIAGIIAVSLNKFVELVDCDVIDCNITDENMETYYESMSRGGISGITNGATYNNCTVKNLDMTVKAQSIGGLAGVNCAKSDIENCIVENVKIKSGSTNNVTLNASIGGIIGDISNSDDNIINKCNVKNTNIITISDNIGGIAGTTSMKLDINDCIIEGVDLTNNNEITLSNNSYNRNIGGILGVAGTTNKITINNPIIKDLDIIAKEGLEDKIHTGGLIGYAMEAEVNNANIGGTNEDGTAIKGINIENNTPNGLVGGIIAVASNPYATSSSTNSEITINNSNILNSTLKGQSHVGGFIGFSTIAEIAESVLNNVEVITQTDTGIVGGFAGVISNNTNETTTPRESKIKITDSTLKNIVLTGLNHIDEFLGAGTIEKENTTSEAITKNTVIIEETV